MKTYQELSILFIFLACIFGLKYFHSVTATDSLTFILFPVTKFVEIFTNAQANYLPTQGYFFEELNIIIDKSCCGMNFWIMSWLMAGMVGLQYFKRMAHQISLLFCTAIITYLLTIWANTSRIVGAIAFHNYFPSDSFWNSNTFHTMQGSFTYLLYLMLFYFLLQRTLNFIHTPNSTAHAKLT